MAYHMDRYLPQKAVLVLPGFLRLGASCVPSKKKKSSRPLYYVKKHAKICDKVRTLQDYISGSVYWKNGKISYAVTCTLYVLVATLRPRPLTPTAPHGPQNSCFPGNAHVKFLQVSQYSST